MSCRRYFVALVLLMSGCATSQKIDAIKNAADQERFQGIDDKTLFSISFPRAHSDSYDAVDKLNFVIDSCTSKQRNGCAVLVKPHKTGVWEVLTMMLEENAQWIYLSKTNTKQYK
ncbi:MAG: hypothetical protein V3U88_12255 [Methylococcales bacterium]